MTLERTRLFTKNYAKIPAKIQKKLDRQLITLVTNFHHPSLNAKKMKGRNELWEARVDYKYRFTFQMQDDIIILRAVGSHDILKKS